MKNQRLKRLSATGGLLLGSVAVALAIGEIVTRVAAPGGGLVGASPALYQHDPLLGWEKRPDAAVSMRTGEWDVRISTNRYGFRGPDVSREKPDGTTRILLLGDSFLEAYSVSQQEMISTVLEQELRASGLEEVEVLNGGTSGYSTDQELLFFVRDGSAFKPDVTVLFFYYNDVWFNSRSSYWRGAKPYYELTDTGLTLRGVPVPPWAWKSRELSDWLTGRSALYRLIRRAVTSGLRTSDQERASDEPTPRSVPAEFVAWRRSPEGEVARLWSLTEALLVRLRDEVEAVGSDFLLFHVASKPAIYDEVWDDVRRGYRMSAEEWSPTADADILRRICDRTSIDCLIPVERFRAEGAPLGDPEALYFPIDGHWTAAGHGLAARLLRRWIAERD